LPPTDGDRRSPRGNGFLGWRVSFYAALAVSVGGSETLSQCLYMCSSECLSRVEPPGPRIGRLAAGNWRQSMCGVSSGADNEFAYLPVNPLKRALLLVSTRCRLD